MKCDRWSDVSTLHLFGSARYQGLVRSHQSILDGGFCQTLEKVTSGNFVALRVSLFQSLAKRKTIFKGICPSAQPALGV